MWWLFHGLTIGTGDQPAARQTVELIVRDIFTLKHPNHAWSSLGGCRIDAFDVGVRVRRSDKHRMRHTRERDVIGILTGTC